MFTKRDFNKSVMKLFNFCDYPAVRYKILFQLLDFPYDSKELTELRPTFHSSDIVEELYREQDIYGGWGKLQSKDYSAKDKFPTSLTAINRCLYIGLTIEDRDILLCANEYLEDFLKGAAREKFRKSNERVVPWTNATVCNAIESIKPCNPLCDRTFGEWLYIAERAFVSGEYSYERERSAQHELFWTREDRLVPMQTELLLKRRDQLPDKLEECLLHHYGKQGYEKGWIWWEVPTKLPENFTYNKTRRWFHTFNYINQFRGSAIYLDGAVDWLMDNKNSDGLWDWGTQVKDPWGYFGYFSTNKNYRHNRVVDGTMEILTFLKKYLDNNE